MAKFDPRELRNAFGSYMTGVTVVTAVSESGETVGFTANSFTSVSVEPPLLLVCPGNHLSSYQVFQECKHFAVNILAEDQQQVSNTFASSKGDRFAEASWQPDVNGCPLIDGAVAQFSCATYQRIEAGDHIVLIGEVESFNTTDKLGLGFAKGGYFSLGLEHRAEQLSQYQGSLVGAIIERDGQVLLSPTKEGFSLPMVPADAARGSLESLKNYLAESGLECELSAVYSIYDKPEQQQVASFYRATAGAGSEQKLGQFHAIDKLSEVAFASEDIKSMMLRYQSEQQSGHYRLYVGDQHSGDIH